MMNNLDEIFAPTNAVVEPEKPKRALEFNPSAKNSKNGVYNAVIRFIPWYKNPSKSVMKKEQIYLIDPLSNRGRYIDSPKSIGEQCIVTDLFWNLYNSQNVSLKEFGKKHINISGAYTALVQIITDDQHPELVGKILPWRFKKSVWDKLMNEQHPQMGMGYNPFDIINGRYFSVKVVQKGGWNNYDQCNFFDYRGQNGETSGMLMLNPAGNSFEIVNANTDRQRVYDYLVANSPDLDVYDYKPWTADESNFVQGVVQTINQYANTGTYGQNVAMATSVTAPTYPQPTSGGVVQQTVTAPIQANVQPVVEMQMPAMPQTQMPTVNMNATMPSVEIPQTPTIQGIDLPDMSTPPVFEMQHPNPQPPVGMGLDNLYGVI